MDRNVNDPDVVVQETRKAQRKHRGQIESASFDRGFYNAENAQSLAEIVEDTYLTPRHPRQYTDAIKSEYVTIHQLRQRHPGIKSAIDDLQSGNGLDRCRDRSEIGFERNSAWLSWAETFTHSKNYSSRAGPRNLLRSTLNARLDDTSVSLPHRIVEVCRRSRCAQYLHPFAIFAPTRPLLTITRCWR